MIKRILYTVVFVAAFICLSGCSFIVGSNYLYQNGDKYTAGDRQIKDKIENISIDYMFGNVKLIGADTDMISVKETTSVRLDDKRKVHTWVDGTTLYVKYCASAKNIDLNNLNKELTVTIPEDMILSDLYVDVSSADVSCENFKSDSVNVNSSSGSINAECEARMIKLSASSGDVYLTQKGSSEEISIETSSGSIDVDMQDATNLSTRASSGDIRIKAGEVKEFKSETSSGYNEIGNIVKFTFRAAATKVRLGIYETIPGYDVKNVSFRPNASEFGATTDNAKLSGSFNGTSSSASGTYNVTYNSTTGIAEFDNTAASAGDHFDFGTFASASTALGVTSTAPMWATGSADYQSVLPNTDNVGNMILKVDYDLVNSVSGETIRVKGAKAVVPQMYMTWKPNYAYTYLFKISDNTNGTTGTEGTSPEGLFPITFDAVTVAATDGQEVGIITTVTTPAITTYQEGSVSAAGITYANANGPIYITVNTNGTLADLTTSNTKLYTVEAGTTEADLILTTKTKTTTSGLLSILAANEDKQGITFASGNAAKFTPAASTTYAVEYKVSDAVNAVYTQVTSGTTLTQGNKYYTSSTGEGEFTAGESATADGSTYELTTPASPAVYQYKIIVVGANP